MHKIFFEIFLETKWKFSILLVRRCELYRILVLITLYTLYNCSLYFYPFYSNESIIHIC